MNQSSDDIVQLARLALAGRRQDVQTYVRRLVKRYHTSVPRLAEQLTGLIRESPTPQSPLRKEALAAIPVDMDSRLQLIRYEHPPRIDVDPIWSDHVRRSLEHLIAERSKENDLARAGLSPTRSVILTGPPGVGKTLAARWIARETGRPLLVLDLSAVMSSLLGRTGSNVRHVLDYAKGVHCVLLLDELDAVAKRRDDVAEIGELKRLVTVLLQEIDDWPPSGLLVAATNHADLLDPAVWRRFEMRVEFPMPSEEQVRLAVEAFLGPVQDQLHEWLVILAVLLQGRSFSDIEHQLTRIRREAVITGLPLEQCLTNMLRDNLGNLPRRDKARIAFSLVQCGLSQRQVHELTSVSRDTIRKAQRK